MSTTATTEIPPGIYRIVVAGGALESQRLTYVEKYVTVLPPGGVKDSHWQEWQIEHSEDDTIVISHVSPIFPLPYLTYDGSPGKPKAGDTVTVKIAPVPLNKWRVKFLPIFKALIQVYDSDLGISIGPGPKIPNHPPSLDLTVGYQLEWRFEFVRPQ